MSNKEDIKDIEQALERNVQIRMDVQQFDDIHRHLVKAAEEMEESEKRKRFRKKASIGFGSAAAALLTIVLIFSLNDLTGTGIDQSGSGSNSEIETEQPVTAVPDERDQNLFQYKGSYVGDNSAVLNIIGGLPHSGSFHELSLETKTEPHGIIVKYEGIESEYRKAAIYNATYLLTLIRNAEWVDFYYGGQGYKITKEELQAWYGVELNEFTTEKELEALIQENMNQEENIIHFYEK